MAGNSGTVSLEDSVSRDSNTLGAPSYLQQSPRQAREEWPSVVPSLHFDDNKAKTRFQPRISSEIVGTAIPGRVRVTIARVCTAINRHVPGARLLRHPVILVPVYARNNALIVSRARRGSGRTLCP